MNHFKTSSYMAIFSSTVLSKELLSNDIFPFYGDTVIPFLVCHLSIMLNGKIVPSLDNLDVAFGAFYKALFITIFFAVGGWRVYAVIYLTFFPFLLCLKKKTTYV